MSNDIQPGVLWFENGIIKNDFLSGRTMIYEFLEFVCFLHPRAGFEGAQAGKPHCPRQVPEGKLPP